MFWKILLTLLFTVSSCFAQDEMLMTWFAKAPYVVNRIVTVGTNWQVKIGGTTNAYVLTLAGATNFIVDWGDIVTGKQIGRAHV